MIHLEEIKRECLIKTKKHLKFDINERINNIIKIRAEIPDFGIYISKTTKDKKREAEYLLLKRIKNDIKELEK